MRIFLLPLGVTLVATGFGLPGIVGGTVIGLGISCLVCWWDGEQEWEEEDETRTYTCK